LTVTFLSNITSIKNQEICPYQLLYGCKPRLQASLRSFGEIGIVTTKDKIQGKLNNRGTPCMFVGYSVHHAHDVYRMLNIETEMIINSQDIIWLNEMPKIGLEEKLKISLLMMMKMLMLWSRKFSCLMRAKRLLKQSQIKMT
jgi:hypothetical protein